VYKRKGENKQKIKQLFHPNHTAGGTEMAA